MCNSTVKIPNKRKTWTAHLMVQKKIAKMQAANGAQGAAAATFLKW
jgi:hypothetical protein